MGKQLRCGTGFSYISILLLLIILTVPNRAEAQLTFENFQPFVLEFSERSDLSNRTSWEISPEDRELIGMFGIPELYHGDEVDGYFRHEDPDGNLYLARRAEGDGGEELIEFRIRNESGRTIQTFDVSLDLAVQTSESRVAELHLEYSNGVIYGEETLLHTSGYSGEAGQWMKSRIERKISNVLLEPGEELNVKLRIQPEETGEGSLDLIALHKIELTPAEFQYEQTLLPGDLIVTEIYPGSETDGETFSYLELYNSTLREINLQGLVLGTGDSAYRIREPLNVEPYGMVVIANRNLERDRFYPDLVLSNLNLPNTGGRIDLNWQGRTIKQVAYGVMTDNRAWELTDALLAADGDVSQDQLESSNQPFTTAISGSPGEAGLTGLMYTREIEGGQGWVTISPPGRLQTELQSENSFWMTKDRNNLPNDKPPGSAILTYISSADAERSRWVSDDSGLDSDFRLELGESAPQWLLLGNPFETEIQLSQVQPAGGSFSGYTGQIWDAELQTFRVINRYDKLKPWDAFFLLNDDAESVQFERSSSGDGVRDAELNERAIRFELQSMDSRISARDQAAVLYFHEEGSDGDNPFQARKLWPVFQNDASEFASLIYFTGQVNNEPAFFSQITRPYEPERRFEVRMGQVSHNVQGRHRLSWGEFENIPEDWELTLTDIETGQTVNMREVNQLTIESVENLNEEPQFSEEPAIHPLELDEPYERFIISVNPEPAQEDAPEDEGPSRDSAELYQNYPNPFYPSTTIHFYIPEERQVVVAVYNIVGQRVAQLMDETLSEGEHEVSWNASDTPSGIYIIHLEYGNRVYTRKMTLIR